MDHIELSRQVEERYRRYLRTTFYFKDSQLRGGKTEAFLYPILLHLYREFIEGSLCHGVQALNSFPMNALG